MHRSQLRRVLFSVALILPMLSFTGCKSAYDKAVEKAKTDAVATGQAQQVISVDKAGKTTVTIVQPPPAPGQPPVVNSNTAPSEEAALAGQPDWSNGVRPSPGNVVTFSGPKKPGYVAPATTSASASEPPPPGSAPSSANPAVAPSNAAGVTQNPDDTPPAHFVPTDVTIPSGTGLAIRVNQRISAKHSRAGERFTGELSEGILRDGKVILPRGTHVNGVVTMAHQRGHFKGRSYLGLRLTSLVYDGKTYPIATSSLVRTKKGKGKRTAGLIGGGAGLGMLVGGIASGGVGLAVGGLSGGGLGTLVAGVTGNRDIEIPAESVVRFRLEDDLTVQPAE